MANDGPERDSIDETAGRLISLAEAAELFELSHSHLRKLVREGKIWGKRIGQYWVTTEEAVKEYLTEDRRPGPKSKER